jgi:hypothetical protein|tara:strand:- start:768 stop:1184 length:417 start_codon:yes stop_codon:yes gene_type:complete
MRKLTKLEQANADALGEAATFHVTATILNKSIQDCNVAIRDLLKREGVIDYAELAPGDKVTLEGVYSDGTETTISAYRAKSRGDKRIWFSGLKNYANAGDVMALVIRSGKLVIQNVTRGIAVAVFAIPALDTMARMTF